MTSGHCRTIPTRVGRTFPPRRSRHGLSDHPHTRGENAWLQPSASLLSGPSPHAWGEPRTGPELSRRNRTIPTRVGRTCNYWRLCPCCADHPHTRGENPGVASAEVFKSGPSPHAWGELPRIILSRPQDRTIPTRVGSTATQDGLKTCNADHPHTRGENASPGCVYRSVVGPSPHAWGEPSMRTAP